MAISKRRVASRPGKRGRIWMGVCILLLGVTAFLCYAYRAAKQEAALATDELAKLQNRQTALTKEHTKLREDFDSLTDNHSDLEMQYNALTDDYAALSERCVAADQTGFTAQHFPSTNSAGGQQTATAAQTPETMLAALDTQAALYDRRFKNSQDRDTIYTDLVKELVLALNRHEPEKSNKIAESFLPRFQQNVAEQKDIAEDIEREMKTKRNARK